MKSAKVDQLARDLASLTGESISQAVESVFEARLGAERRRASSSAQSLKSWRAQRARSYSMTPVSYFD